MHLKARHLAAGNGRQSAMMLSPELKCATRTTWPPSNAPGSYIETPTSWLSEQSMTLLPMFTCCRCVQTEWRCPPPQQRRPQ